MDSQDGCRGSEYDLGLITFVARIILHSLPLLEVMLPSCQRVEVLAKHRDGPIPSHFFWLLGRCFKKA